MHATSCVATSDVKGEDGIKSTGPTAFTYSTYYKRMGDLPYISSEQGGLIIRTKLIYEYTIIIISVYKS